MPPHPHSPVRALATGTVIALAGAGRIVLEAIDIIRAPAGHDPVLSAVSALASLTLGALLIWLGWCLAVPVKAAAPGRGRLAVTANVTLTAVAIAAATLDLIVWATRADPGRLSDPGAWLAHIATIAFAAIAGTALMSLHSARGDDRHATIEGARTMRSLCAGEPLPPHAANRRITRKMLICRTWAEMKPRMEKLGRDKTGSENGAELLRLVQALDRSVQQLHGRNDEEAIVHLEADLTSLLTVMQAEVSEAR